MDNVVIFVGSLNPGGIANVAITLSEMLANSGYSVELISGYTLPVVKVHESVTLLSLESPAARYRFLKPFIFYKRVLAMRKLIYEKDYRALICLDPSSFIVSHFSLSPRKIELKVACCFTPIELLTLSDKLIMRMFYKRAERVIVPNSSLSAWILTLSSKVKVKVIPPGLSKDSINCSLDKGLEYKSDFLFMGRLSEEKGVALFCALAQKCPEFNFLVSGNGPDAKVVENAQKITPNLRWIKWGNPNLLLPGTKVLVVPSILESFGIVVIESMLHGTPVIAYKYAEGPAELIQKYNFGEIVKDYHNPDEWISAMKNAMSGKRPFNIERRILEDFSVYSLAPQWLEA
jgi:glycosyltransferase involved in cell wall biosynthesis